MTAPSIRADGLGKRYLLGEHHSFGSLRETLVERVRAFGRSGPARERTSIWALKDVSFEIAPGEAVGVIGRNGAGKSTLLKVLSRITEPTTGRAEICGRVGSLLEVGTGFHPELTGRENIFLNGAILGMKRTEIAAKFDEIVAFAEVEQFIDTPVKRYSSGMYLRLAFAVAAHLEPEILLVDEVLAVGDAVFQKKCLGKMGDVTRQGRTVLFVSHNMSAINRLCEKVVWIDRGCVARIGSPLDVVTDYLTGDLQRPVGSIDLPIGLHAHEPRGLRFDSIELLDPHGQPTSRLLFDQPTHFRISMHVTKHLPAVRLAVAVMRLEGTLVAALHQTDDQRQGLATLDPGRYMVEVSCPVRLMPGSYTVGLLAKPDPGFWGSGEPSLDFLESTLVFHVDPLSKDGFAPLASGAILHAASSWVVSRIDTEPRP